MTNSNLSWLIDEDFANSSAGPLSTRPECLRQDLDTTAEGLAALGERCFFLGYYEHAENYWRQSLQRVENEKARKWLNYYHRVSFQHWLRRYHKAVWELKRRNYAVAKEMLYTLAREFDQSVSLFKFLGYAAWLCGDVESALEAWRKGLRLDPNDAEMNRYLRRIENLSVRALTGNGNPITVRYGLRRLKAVLRCSFDKQHERKWFAVGSILLLFAVVSNCYAFLTLPASTTLTQDTDNLSIVYQNAQTNFTAMPDAVYNDETEEAAYQAGHTAYIKKEFAAAKEQFTLFLSICGDNELRPPALFYLAHCCYELKDPAVANHFFNEYIMIYPDGPWVEKALYFSGLAYYQMGDIYSAKIRLKQLKTQFSNSDYLDQKDSQYIINL